MSLPGAGWLVTSIGAKRPLLSCLRQAGPATLWGGDIDPDCLARPFVDAFWQMPALSDCDSPAPILDFCHRERIGFILPTRDGELAWWSQWAPEFEAMGARCMVSPPEAIRRCQDKLLFHQTLTQWGFPLVPTWSEWPDGEKTPERRWVVKERWGSGSRNMGVNLSAAEADQHARGLEHPIYQPQQSGREWSADVYVNRLGHCVGVVPRWRRAVIRGESQLSTTFRHPALERDCRLLAERLNLYGHAVFQGFLQADDAYHFLECNPRFGGASTLSVQAGLDSFRWFLQESLSNEAVSPQAFKPRAQPLTLIRTAVDQFLEGPVDALPTGALRERKPGAVFHG